jgi:hypothetical protein
VCLVDSFVTGKGLLLLDTYPPLSVDQLGRLFLLVFVGDPSYFSNNQWGIRVIAFDG